MLHLDAHERSVPPGIAAERVDQLAREPGGEIEPERRRLQRHVAAQLLLAQHREELAVLGRHRPGVRLAAHRLPQDRHARRQVAPADLADHGDGLLDPLTREMTRRDRRSRAACAAASR